MQKNGLLKYAAITALLLLLSACETPTGRQSGTSSTAALESLSPAQASLFQSAIADLEQKNPKSAEASLQSLLREREDIAELWLNLALSQYQQQDYAEAEKILAKVLVAFPRVEQGHNMAGLIAVEKGEFKQAQQHYQEALRLNPSYPNALYNMALLQDVYLQDIASAIEYYNRYLAEVKDDEATKAWVENLVQSQKP